MKKIRGMALMDSKAAAMLLRMALAAAIAGVVVPMVIGEGYTYLCEDDFSFEGGAKDAALQYGGFYGAVHRAYDYWQKWQGTYLSNFLWHIVRPYARWGLEGFHAMMVGGGVAAYFFFVFFD